jgi:hypothetical protein
MSIPYHQFELSKQINCGLTIVGETMRPLCVPRQGFIGSIQDLIFGKRARQVRHVTAASLPIRGIRGSARGSIGKTRPVDYVVVFELTNLLTTMPDAWILKPVDAEICHVNVFKPSTCGLFQTKLPRLCWGTSGAGTYRSVWCSLSSERRTLSQLVEYTKQFLNSENPNSPAR